MLISKRLSIESSNSAMNSVILSLLELYIKEVNNNSLGSTY